MYTIKIGNRTYARGQKLTRSIFSYSPRINRVTGIFLYLIRTSSLRWPVFSRRKFDHNSTWSLRVSISRPRGRTRNNLQRSSFKTCIQRFSIRLCIKFPNKLDCCAFHPDTGFFQRNSRQITTRDTRVTETLLANEYISCFNFHESGKTSC